VRTRSTTSCRTRLQTVGAGIAVIGLTAASVLADPFFLVDGVDAGKYPDTSRPIFPMTGFPGTFHDGDRLAGDTPTGANVTWQGSGAPMFSTNQFGSLSFLLRRGSVPAGGPNLVPFMGIEFLGGPLLDLDGDLGNTTRSLIPVADPNDPNLPLVPLAIPGQGSRIDLTFDTGGGTVALDRFDATGTNEGASGLDPAIGVTVNVLAGTPTSFEGKTPPANPTAINPTIDDRAGTVTAHGTIAGVWQIDDLGFEFWNDTQLFGSSTSPVLGTLQTLDDDLQGWLVTRPSTATAWPTMAGQLGATLWPTVESSGVMMKTAPSGASTVTIGSGPAGDPFGAEGLATADLGAYLDSVVVPSLFSQALSFVYLEASGVGVNNSFDPVFGDTIGYDAVIIAQTPEPGTGALAVMIAVGVLARRPRRRRH